MSFVCSRKYDEKEKKTRILSSGEEVSRNLLIPQQKKLEEKEWHLHFYSFFLSFLLLCISSVPSISLFSLLLWVWFSPFLLLFADFSLFCFTPYFQCWILRNYWFSSPVLFFSPLSFSLQRGRRSKWLPPPLHSSSFLLVLTVTQQAAHSLPLILVTARETVNGGCN